MRTEILAPMTKEEFNTKAHEIQQQMKGVLLIIVPLEGEECQRETLLAAPAREGGEE